MAAVLVSTTLTGSNADIIGPALRSVVPYVDLCLVIDTGATDDTMGVAADVAGEKFRAATFTWCNDFAAARNFALQHAAALGATWAVTVDTDERIITDRESNHATATRRYDTLRERQENEEPRRKRELLREDAPRLPAIDGLLE